MGVREYVNAHNTGLFGALHLKDLPIIKNYPYGVCTRVAGYPYCRQVLQSKACFYVMRIILYPRRGLNRDNRQVLNEGEARMQLLCKTQRSQETTLVRGLNLVVGKC